MSRSTSQNMRGLILAVVVMAFFLIIVSTAQAGDNNKCSCVLGYTEGPVPLNPAESPNPEPANLIRSCEPECDRYSQDCYEDNCHMMDDGTCGGSCKCKKNPVSSICGDTICGSLESSFICPSDCTVVCGDFQCEAGEERSCPRDCYAKKAGQWWVESNLIWLDQDDDGTIDRDTTLVYGQPDDFIKTSIESYDVYGNILVSINELGVRKYTLFDERNWQPIKGWFEGYGSADNPEWEKSYYDNGLLETEYNENREPITFYYNDRNELIRSVNSRDSFESPTEKIELHLSSGPNDHARTVIQRRIDDNRYSENVKYYDGWYRQIQLQRKLSDGKYLIINKEYDRLDNLKVLYAPFFADTGSVYLDRKGEPREEYYYQTFTKSVIIKAENKEDGSLKRYYYGVDEGQPVIMGEDQNQNTWYYRFDIFGGLISASEGLKDNYNLTSVEK